MLPDPTPVAEADVLLLESTYGDRLHEPDDNGARLAAIVNDAAARGGKLIIPSFAIGRVEEVLYWLKRLEEEKRIPVLPVYVDSPMAIARLAVLLRPPQRAGRRSCSLRAAAQSSGLRATRGRTCSGMRHVVGVRHDAHDDDRVAAAVG